MRLGRQFGAYFMIGGAAALIEWLSFYLFHKGMFLHYIVATTMAFIIATYANWLIGKRTLFKDSNNAMTGTREFYTVYMVSFLGLLWNILIMHVLIDRVMVDAMLAKIFATGIVFIWNFTIRKVYIYKI